MPYFTWKQELVSNIFSMIVPRNSFFASNSPQVPLNLIFFDNFGNSKAFNTGLTYS